MKLKPRLTEKSLQRAGTGVYTFGVPLKSTKPEIVRTLSKLFNVTVTKITTSTRKPKLRRFKRIKGAVSAVKYAHIHLKKGMTIPGFEFSSESAETPPKGNAKTKLKAENKDAQAADQKDQEK